MGYDSNPRIPVAHQVFAQDEAYWKAGLYAESAGATSVSNTPGGQYQAKPWRKCELCIAVSYKLVAVV